MKKAEINPGHYFELLDRTHIASSYLQMALGEHPVLTEHSELMALYEAGSTGWRLFIKPFHVTTKPGNNNKRVRLNCPGHNRATFAGTPVLSIMGKLASSRGCHENRYFC